MSEREFKVFSSHTPIAIANFLNEHAKDGWELEKFAGDEKAWLILSRSPAVAHLDPATTVPEPPKTSEPATPPAPPVANTAQPAGERETAIAEIKRLTFDSKLASNLSLWNSFEMGLFGKKISEALDIEIFAGRDALRKFSSNSEILNWNVGAWQCSSEMKAEIMGLIIAHAHIDGFEKTKAITGDPSKIGESKVLKMRRQSLLSWVRPEQLEREQSQKAA